MVDRSKTTVNRQIKSEVLCSSSIEEVAVMENHKCTQSNRCSEQERIKHMGMVTMELLKYNRAVKQCFQKLFVETLMNNYIGKI